MLAKLFRKDNALKTTAVGILCLSLIYFLLFQFEQPIAADIQERINLNKIENAEDLEHNRMQNLFMKERSWNFVILSSIVIVFTVWFRIQNPQRKQSNFLGYKYRLQDRFEKSKMGIPDFQVRLKRKFNQLTSNDCIVAEMLHDGLNTKEIAVELNISTASANTARYRLRKKMQLENKTDLISFLKEI